VAAAVAVVVAVVVVAAAAVAPHIPQRGRVVITMERQGAARSISRLPGRCAPGPPLIACSTVGYALTL